MIAQITKISYFLIPFLIILGSSFYYSFQKLKEVETKKIKLLYAEISSEKKVAFQLENVPKVVEKINNATQNKLLKIKVAIFNVDFTLNEIL